MMHPTKEEVDRLNESTKTLTTKMLLHHIGKPLKVISSMPRGFDEAFDKVCIPWYLKPFRKVIERICRGYAMHMLFSDSSETITFKRPHAFTKTEQSDINTGVDLCANRKK